MVVVVECVGGSDGWWCGGGGDKELLAAFADPVHTDGSGGDVDACCVDGCK